MMQQIFLAQCGCRIVPLSRKLSYFRILLHCNAHGGSVSIIVIALVLPSMTDQQQNTENY